MATGNCTDRHVYPIFGQIGCASSSMTVLNVARPIRPTSPHRDLSKVKFHALALDSSYLFIQGHRCLIRRGAGTQLLICSITANELEWLRKATRRSTTC